MYILQEMQTTGGVTALVPAITEPDVKEAESKFLLACSYAVKSSVEVHTVICVDEHGNNCFGSPKYYEHLPEVVEG